jgi:diguanylate cyclase (GGDEF)-like protein
MLMGATHLIHGVAASTAQRDPEQLDHAIGQLLCRFLSARSIALYHLLREEDGSSHTAIRIDLSAEGVRTDTVSIDLPNTPALSEEIGVCKACTANNQFVERASIAGELLTAFPVHTSPDIVRVLVVASSESLTVSQIDMVFGVLRIIENHLALLDYGERDTLTGLLNRKTFENHFEKMRRRHAIPTDRGNSHEPSWLALADIDKFKSINDSHGHLFGDEVLLIVSQILKRSFRGGDQLFRFGGEEFLIVLDHATEAGAHAALDRFRAAVEAHAFPQIERVTISLGYTRILPHDVPTICSERADDALYFAKRNGRNRLCHYETLVADGSLKPKSNITEIELF